MAMSNPLRGERKAGTVGKPLPGVEVSKIFLFLGQNSIPFNNATQLRYTQTQSCDTGKIMSVNIIG